ncbi:hypothetical protein GCM10020256_15540 [Streptomyces thermocoprophilus]
MTRWSTLLLDDASLAQMPELPVDHVLRHADLVTAQQPKPQALYERWEKQQWNAQAIDLEQDRLDYEKRLPPRRPQGAGGVHRHLHHRRVHRPRPARTDPHRRPPEEIDHLYLGTQIADETRHTQLMLRLGEEVLGLDPDPKRMLVQAWNMCTPPHRALSRLETEIIREIQHRPSDYEAWLRTVALFHLISEGVLALVGQRAIVRSLHDIPMLPGVKAGFTAMCRDESRHVSFGLHALRQGVREGYTEAICDVIEQAAPLALRIEEGGAVEDAPEGTSMRDLGIDSLRRQLRLIGVDDVFAEHVVGLVTRPAPAEGH